MFVIIPAYNEAENIAATVDELLAKTRSFPMELDYLVVNDGSSDNGGGSSGTRLSLYYAARESGNRRRGAERVSLRAEKQF